jgi:hypothetical protein
MQLTPSACSVYAESNFRYTQVSYAGDWDIINDRWDINYNNGRNKAGRGAAKVGTFNKFLIDAGFGERIQYQPETSAAEDGLTDEPEDPFEPKGDPAKIKEQQADREAVADEKRTGRFEAARKNYTLCASPVAFIARDSTKLVSKATFSARYNSSTARMKIPARYKDDAAKYVISLQYGKIERVDGMSYRPGDDRRIVDGKANMWVKPPITPLDEEPTILIEHINYLIPDEVERKLLLDWLAHCVQKPMEKLMFALLIVDDKGGTGKSWFGYLMQVILGAENVAMVDDTDPLLSQ